MGGEELLPLPLSQNLVEVEVQTEDETEESNTDNPTVGKILTVVF